MKYFLTILAAVVFTATTYAKVGIGTTNPNAALDVTSTTQGFLPPRMTTTQRNAISPLAVGLVIFNTTTNCLNFYVGRWIEICGTGSYPAGSVFCASGATAVVDVLNPITNKIWMDRNLGATQAATGSADANSYGDLYQWGRRADGHQCRNSSTTATLSSIDQPTNGNFITINSGNYDWRSPQNVNLWQGVNGVNNPCPSGYRLPTETEINAERLSWGSNNNATGAFGSPLKLPMAGSRLNNGTLDQVNTRGRYWSSTVSGTVSKRLYFDTGGSAITPEKRAEGSSVRCLKD